MVDDETSRMKSSWVCSSVAGGSELGAAWEVWPQHSGGEDFQAGLLPPIQRSAIVVTTQTPHCALVVVPAAFKGV